MHHLDGKIKYPKIKYPDGLDPIWRASEIGAFGLGRMAPIMESMEQEKSSSGRLFTPEGEAEVVEGEWDL
ncbi:hypothetical protein [Streptomyces antarcticus]|uniref:hypothetical protein n=1 Tax=Streptomyces antarcticus TaxID=2996458 RepID=UPI00226D5632|nr:MULTISPECIES: hypothetical protein [unclassified Streptomyces]MCY0942405.1 hypothetical protein [Streptomyces sp. H34-AA3]MCZ4080598.1 hypothetical protein [Streptomyces sp. H34-S5]